MRSSHWLLVLRLCALVALGASAALLVDYTAPAATFCGAGSGCAAVKQSAFSHLLGVPLPAIGIVAFAGLLGVSLWGAGRARFLLPLALAGGAIGLLLIGLQAFGVGAFCNWCLVVDVAAVAAAGAALAHARGGGQDRSPIAAWGFAALGALIVAAPFVWARAKPQLPVPDPILALYEPGKINVVEFADFECPYCRALHPRIKALLAEYPAERVHFVRMHVPLPRHVHARGAASAAVCAEKQGKGDAMADALFEANDLGKENIRALANGLGLQLEAFEACLEDPATDAVIERHIATLRDNDFKGLPTTYIGGRRIVGAQSDEAFREALERAARGADETGVPGWLFATLLLLLAGGIVLAARRRAETPAGGATAGTRESAPVERGA